MSTNKEKYSIFCVRKNGDNSFINKSIKPTDYVIIFGAQIEIQLCAKERPRVNTKTGRVYTPSKTKNFERELGYTLRHLVKNFRIEKEFCLSVSIGFFFSNKKKISAQETYSEIIKGSKPDIDNLCKSVLDAMNGIIYVDDAQICELSTRKYYTNNPHDFLEIQVGIVQHFIVN